MVTMCLIKFEENKICIMANDDWSIQAFNTVEDGLSYFEKSYNRGHSRGYESSISACLNHITFQPSIITVKDIEEIRDNVATKEPHKLELSHVSGFMRGITCRPEAKGYWETGKKPSLIKG